MTIDSWRRYSGFLWSCCSGGWGLDGVDRFLPRKAGFRLPHFSIEGVCCVLERSAAGVDL